MYVELLVPHLLLNPCLTGSLGIFMGITSEDIHLHWLNLFLFFILMAGLLAILLAELNTRIVLASLKATLIGYIIFLSPFIDVKRMFMVTKPFS